MIRLAELARVRLGRGRLVHEVTPAGSRLTACGEHIHLEDLWGRKHDTALGRSTPITCNRCTATERTQP